MEQWSSSAGSFTANAYEFLRFRSTPVRWRKVVWESWSLPRYSFILWLTVLGRLRTRDRLHFLQTDSPCVFCHEDDETHSHLFFGFRWTSTLWLWVKQWLHLTRCMSSLSSALWGLCRGGNNMVGRMRRVSLGILVYIIWEERNKRIFDSSSTPIASLFKFQTLFFHCFSFPRAWSFLSPLWLMSFLVVFASLCFGCADWVFIFICLSLLSSAVCILVDLIGNGGCLLSCCPSRSCPSWDVFPMSSMAWSCCLCFACWSCWPYLFLHGLHGLACDVTSIVDVFACDWLGSFFFFNCCHLWSLSMWGNTFGGLFIAAFVRSPFYLCGLSAWLAWLPLAHIVLYVLEFGLWILGSGLSCFVFY